MQRIRLLVALTLLSCAHAPSSFAPQPFRCPAAGGAPWIEVVSRHFRLRTDLPADRARAALLVFEERFEPTAALVDQFVPGYGAPGETDVVVFTGEAEIAWLSGGATGAFQTRDDRGTPVIVVSAARVHAGASTVPHELVHRFLYRRLPGVPSWLNEGLAMRAGGPPRLPAEQRGRIPALAALVHGSPSTFAMDDGEYHLGS